MTNLLIRKIRRLLPTALLAVLFVAGLVPVGEGLAQSIRKDSFNHLTTGFALTGAHEQTRCENCHVQGIFKGTPKDCLQCHGPAARISSITMPQNHIPVSDKCDVCHSTTKFYGVRFNHANVIPGNCTQCHNGTTAAPGKPARHIVTVASCDTCHRIMTWLPATFSHNNVAPGSCAQCHNGTTAGGKSATHLITSSSCDSCHTTTAWIPGIKFDHLGVIPGTCSQCHDGTRAAGQKPGHPVTGASCDACHSPTGWLPARVDHSTVVPGTCAACHNGTIATGKKLNHIPTTDSCDRCHTPTAWLPTAFKHQGVAQGTCAQCHNGTIATGKTATHLATSSSCDSCHAIAGWLPVAFDHKGVAAGSCGNCHNGVNATGKTATHIPVTGNACDACHSKTNYASFAGTTMNHGAVTGVACATCHESGTSFFSGTVVTRPTVKADPQHPLTGDCGSCHNTSSFGGVSAKPANHLPTSQACTLCHTAPGTYAGGVMNHQGIAGNCAQCHGPGSSFVGVTPKSPPAGHIPSTGIACEGCHSVNNFTTFANAAINHAAVPGTACLTCHETGRTWFGVTTVTRPTPAADPNHPKTGDCGGCHNTTSFAVVASKPANHLPTAQPCSLCHANPGTYAGGVMNHQGITGNCAQCHGPGISFVGVTPVSTPATHIPATGVACESCHSASNFSTFSSTLMNHAGTGAIACQTCHETGKTWFGLSIVTRPTPAADPAHPKTGDCGGSCHNTTSFSGFAKPANHIPTILGCSTCHSDLQNFKTYVMSHQGIANNCSQCHGPGLVFATNFVPKAPPSNHIPSGTVACESCHSPANFTAFSGTLMNHAGTGAIACQSCHETGMTWFGITTVTRPTAAADPNHPKPGTGDCSACHTTSSFKTATAKPANHIPTTLACTSCHTNPADFKVYTMSHQGIASGCATCHGPGLTFATNFVPKAPPANHIPTNAGACEACHSATNFTTFGGTAMNHTPVAALTCATCHETGKTFFGVTIVTRPAPAADPAHPTTGDCGACHNTTTFKTTTKPANHIPTTQPCALCHTTSDYSKAVMNHQGIASNCAQCHGPNLSFANIVPKAPPGNHVPYNGLACESCHAAANFATFAGTTMKHAGITATCISCHTDSTAANAGYYGVSIVTTGSPGPHLPLTYGVSACSTCHAAPYDPPTGTFLNGISSSSKVFHANATVPKGGCLPCHQSPAAVKPTGPEKITTQSASHQGGKSCDGSGCHTTATFSKALLVPGADPRPAAKPLLVSPSNAVAAGPGTGLAKPLQIGSGNSANPHVGAVPGGCATCHNGVAGPAKPAKHLVTLLSCDACHRTTSWVPASYRHAGVVPGQCGTCHNNIGAKAKPANHVLTLLSCDSCHRTNAWTPLLPSTGGPAGTRPMPKPLVK